jgi:hypothetical protein
MAEPAAPEPRTAGPALGSTADLTPYVPVSWLAVAAAASAAALGILLFVLGALAWRSKRPLLETELLILAVVAVVMSFAARRVIRNSEGTRTGVLFGIDLPNFAWWGGLVFGLGFVSYLMAIEFSIQRDSKAEVQNWSEWVVKGDAESMNRAFHRTQDPGQRKTVPPTDGEKLEARWGKEYIAFRQSDFRRLAERNPDQTHLELGGLREWRYLPAGVECAYTATLTCPEGSFPILIPMRGMEGGADAGRQWQIMNYPTGYIEKDRAKLTPYGWLVAEIGISGGIQARTIITAATLSRELRASVLPEYGERSPKIVELFKEMSNESNAARAAAFGVPAAVAYRPRQELLDVSARMLFKLPGGAEPDPARLETFKKAWSESGIVKAGDRLRESTDTNDRITFTENSVLHRMPVEIPLSTTTAARGALVLECTDAAIVAELKKLRQSADPAAGTLTPERQLGARNIPWRLRGIESDLKPVRIEAMKSPQQMGPG